MSDLIKETIEKIKSEGKKPISKWSFLVIRFFKWFLVFLASFFSAVALSAIIFLIFQFDWDASRKFGGPISFGFRFLPYFWIVVGGFLIFGLYETIRHTSSGYKYNWKKMTIIIAGLIFGVGVIAHVVGLGKSADTVARRNIPIYGAVVPEMKDQWMNPNEGFLAGEITSSKNDEIEIMDFDGNRWKIVFDEKTVFMPMAEISKGEGIKIIGEEISKGVFSADEIRPWIGNRMQRKFNQDEFRDGYKHMTRPEVKGESRKGPRNERWN